MVILSQHLICYLLLSNGAFFGNPFLFNKTLYVTFVQDVHSKVETTSIWGQEKRSHSNSSNKKGKSKSSARASKAQNHKKKC